MVAAEVPIPTTDLNDYLDSVAAMVSDYFCDCPDELVAEVVVPVDISDDELEELLPWLSDLIAEAGIEERCTVSYDPEEREIRVERN
jgi:hypothetical protein